MAIREGTASGRFRPRRSQEEVVDVLLALIDGCELQAAAGLDGMAPQRLRTLVLTTAELELGLR